MSEKDKTAQDLPAENEELRSRLAEAEETLRAIGSGEVDAVVVSGPEGDRVFTLKGEERTYRILVESMNEGALILSPEGMILYANSAFATMLMIPLEKIIGAPMRSLLAESDLPVLETLLESGAGWTVKREMRLKRLHDDGWVTAYISFSPMIMDETESISVVVTNVTERKNIEEELVQYREHLEELVQARTNELRRANEELQIVSAEFRQTNENLIAEVNERKRAEDALRESERHFRAVFDSTTDAIVVMDDGGTNVSANPALAEILSLSQDELVGRKISDFMEPGFDFQGMWSGFMQAGSISAERKLILTDGAVRTVESRGVANMLPGRHLFVMHDVTDEVSLRDQLQGQVTLLQRALLPPTPRKIGDCEVASAYIPAYAGQEIGGDFFDVFTTESGHVAVMIGDVSGKGIPAAALAAVTRSTVHAFAYDLSSPGRALSHSNAILAGNQISSAQFVTVFLAVLDPKTGDLMYCSAGHPPAIICRAGGVTELLSSFNVPLGVMPNAEHIESASRLGAGDKLVIYTDGISEARAGTELFGSERLEEVLVKHGSESPEALVKTILDVVGDWTQGKLRDDTAMVVIARKA